MRFRQQLCLAIALTLAPAGVGCDLRMIEPRLEDISRAAAGLVDARLGESLEASDPATRQLAIVARWYAARGDADTERRTRATADLFDVWERYRPAGRLMRIVAAGLAEEGWPSPSAGQITRRLSQLGDRDAVLARARELAATGDADQALLAEALRGVSAMTLQHDAQALEIAGELLDQLGEAAAVRETILFRAETGDPEALALLAQAYDGAFGEHCGARARLVRVLFASE